MVSTKSFGSGHSKAIGPRQYPTNLTRCAPFGLAAFGPLHHQSAPRAKRRVFEYDAGSGRSYPPLAPVTLQLVEPRTPGHRVDVTVVDLAGRIGCRRGALSDPLEVRVGVRRYLTIVTLTP